MKLISSGHIILICGLNISPVVLLILCICIFLTAKTKFTMDLDSDEDFSDFDEDTQDDFVPSNASPPKIQTSPK